MVLLLQGRYDEAGSYFVKRCRSIPSTRKAMMSGPGAATSGKYKERLLAGKGKPERTNRTVAGSTKQDPAYGVWSQLLTASLLVFLSPLLHLSLPLRTKLRCLRLLLWRQHCPDVGIQVRLLDRHLHLRLRQVLSG